MKFNKLYLHGFKSFVEKTSVDFHGGITAIVGPNGSGKSNIMDAVRWVFGEQNAKELRGTEMEDVVFNGSQKRKAAGFAEVGLTLSDIDEAVASKYGTFSDITITRKFYKTGEREYYINNRKCRLKDIKDIFMDTGLGARSISIIEQGKVDKIINATPEELRFFLEETAGVTRFKDKKKEAERRLEQTKDNLDRVNDIITEIVGRMDGLSVQVETLKKGEELQSRKRSLEKKYLSCAYGGKAAELAELEARLKAKKTELEEKIAVYASVVKRETEIASNYSQSEKNHAEIQEKRLEITKKTSKTDGDISALQARLASSGDLKAQLEKDIEENSARLENNSASFEAMEEEFRTAQTALEEINDKLEEISDTLEDIKAQKSELDDNFKLIDTEFLEYTSLITTKRNEIIRLEMGLESQQTSITRFTAEKETLTKTFKEMSEIKENLSKNLASAEDHAKTLEEKLKSVKSEAEILKISADSAKMKQSEFTSSLKHIKENIAFTESQISDSAFGKDAKIFFDKFKPTPLLEKIKLGVQEKIIEFGDIFVFNDSDKDAVIAESKNLKSSLRFIFQSGLPQLQTIIDAQTYEKIAENFYLSGPIYKKAGDDDKSLKIVSFKNRLEEEKLKLVDAEQNIESLTTEIAERDLAIAFKTAEIEETESNLQNVKTSLSKYRAESLSAENEAERGAKRIATIDKEIELASLTFMETESKLVTLKAALDDLAAKQSHVEDKRGELEEKLDYINDRLDEKREAMQELKIMQSARSEKLTSAKREIENSKKERENISKNIENLKNRLYKLVNEDEASWINNIEALKTDLQKFQTELLSAESELKQSSQDMENLRTELETLRKDGEKANDAVKETDDNARKTELSIASVSSSIESDAAQYLEKFGEDITLVYKEFADPSFQPKKTKEEIASIETEIDTLGPINLNAVNDYEEAKSRYDFLTGQRSDLEGSVADINSFINDTDETTVKMFKETFESVKDKFIEVFHILFGNGEAELRLTDGENLLSTGVEIYIQPPGKKLQHMGLLSGGEKALTAMTLLFALFLQKPTPFCFLDEVDAPLDDANVERYINMVKTLSDKTQFILITHNHNTMAAADSLYGVTMQEYGISTILSVRLEEAAKAGR